MGRYLLRSLSIAGFFSILIVAFAGSPAKAGSAYSSFGAYSSHGLYTQAGWRGHRYSRRSYRKHRSSRRHFRRHNTRRYYPRRYRYRDRSGIAFGLGVLGGALLAQPYVNSYSSRGRGYCHVHRYRVRGMSFHRDVRCFKHQNWSHPSITYVR